LIIKIKDKLDTNQAIKQKGYWSCVREEVKAVRPRVCFTVGQWACFCLLLLDSH